MNINKPKETDITNYIVGILIVLIGILIIRSSYTFTSTRTSTTSRASEMQVKVSPTLTQEQKSIARDNWCKTHVPLNVDSKTYDSSKDYCLDGDDEKDSDGKVCGLLALRENYLDMQKPGTLIDNIIYNDKTTKKGLTCGVLSDHLKPGANRCCRNINSEVIKATNKLDRVNIPQFGDQYCQNILGDSNAACIDDDTFKKSIGLSPEQVCQARHNLPVTKVTCAQVVRSGGIGYATDSLKKGYCCGNNLKMK